MSEPTGKQNGQNVNEMALKLKSDDVIIHTGLRKVSADCLLSLTLLNVFSKAD